MPNEAYSNLTSSELLIKLKNEKENLINTGRLRAVKDKKLPNNDVPFTIPSHWIWARLRDLSIIQEGPGIRKHQYADEGVQFLTVTNILKAGSVDLKKSEKFISFDEYDTKYRHFELNKNDIVIACSGASWGKSAIFNSDEKIILNTSTLRLRFFGDIGDNKYLFYATKTDFFNRQIQEQLSGQQPNFGYSHYSKVYLPVPPIQEQKRIVALLDTVFADLEQTRAKTEQNLKNARELFDSYLQQVFSQKGEGWEEKKWGEICKFIRGPFGGSLKKSMFKSEGYAVYEQKHAIHDHIEQLRYFVDEEKFEEMKRFELKPGELIMSCSGVTLGRASVIPDGAPKGIINQALLKLTANDDLDIHFLKYWIRSKIFQDIIFEHAGGAAIPNVPAAKILKEIKLQIPTIEKQKIIVSEVDSMVSKRDSLLRIYSEKLNAIDELKKSILQKAFSGKLTTTAK